jgi:PKD repeat protein
VQLTILTASGCSSSYQTNLVVSNGGVNCSASFTSSPDTVSSNPFDVVFHDNSLHQLPIQQWKWYFGDGDSSSYQDPTHQFPHAGIFPVRLVITTADCSSEIVIPIQVGNPQKYNLWGRVYVGNKTTDMCIAYLYKDFNNFIIPFDTVELTSVNDTLGVYYFYQVPEGNYKVHVELPTASQHAVSYAPTYYNSSLYWAQAQSIGVFQDLSLQNVDMTPLFAMVGTDYISGTVVGNGSKEHILVFLLNYQGEVVKYTHTDGNGDYQFTNVPQGDFLVQGECAGMASYPVNIQFTTAYDSLFNVDFHLVPGVLTGIYQSDKPIKNQSFKLFPNPILGSELTIQFDFMIDHDFEYTLYNAMGQKLKQGILASGKAAHRISLEGLIPGVYFMEVIGGDGRRIDVKRLIY